MTYGEFLEKYEKEIDVLDVYYSNGNEVPHTQTIPYNAKIREFSRRSGWFDVVLKCESSDCESPDTGGV